MCRMIRKGGGYCGYSILDSAAWADGKEDIELQIVLYGDGSCEGNKAFNVSLILMKVRDRWRCYSYYFALLHKLFRIVASAISCQVAKLQFQKIDNRWRHRLNGVIYWPIAKLMREKFIKAPIDGASRIFLPKRDRSKLGAKTICTGVD